MTSIVVPAHNEERVLGRLLSALVADAAPGELDVVVVANGCSDATAEVAAGFGGVRVVETPVPSKSGALRLGDAAAAGYPRLYVDADVVLRTADVRALTRALATPGVLAAGPVRQLPMDGVRWPVRWYYDVWQRLPAVRDELFGRGVVVLAEAGHARLGEWGDVMADDLAVATAFDAAERVVVPDAVVEIRPPRTYADLLRRRVRAMTGNARLAAARPAGRRLPRTGARTLARLVAADPRLAPKAALFLVTAVVARLRARRADPGTWLRDESSRTP
ncbi:glycosyltransferase [Jiangella gansuensis]|uniref:glycosyltransferase n=1 Tax=Jiangella gansuensis TaxID=281473 RepID=UPI00047B5B10|nr:glycosyltransferase family 2 protein [Jiangella gansuensis]